MIKTIIKGVVIAEAVTCVFAAGIGVGFSSFTAIDPELGEEFRNVAKAYTQAGPLNRRILFASVLVGEKFGRYLAKDSIEA